MRKTVLTAAAGAALLISNAQAADLEWVAGANNISWGDTNNWSPAQLPAAGDTLTFLDAGATNIPGITTSVMNLSNPSPFEINTLIFNPTSNNFHRVDLDGSDLKLNTHFRVGYNNGGSISDIEVAGGNFLIGDASNRANNVAIGYINSSGGAFSEGRAAFDVFNFDLHVETLDIGRRFNGGSFPVTGELDLSASDSVLIDANRV